ncbi:hypothetical protein BT69DRAFT_1353985 [Atractiella rhizophila]|nr:hypothetical protein BT69DRAFT_1353985 [Atractiella rhizophila]
MASNTSLGDNDSFYRVDGIIGEKRFTIETAEEEETLPWDFTRSEGAVIRPIPSSSAPSSRSPSPIPPPSPEEFQGSDYEDLSEDTSSESSESSASLSSHPVADELDPFDCSGISSGEESSSESSEEAGSIQKSPKKESTPLEILTAANGGPLFRPPSSSPDADDEAVLESTLVKNESDHSDAEFPPVDEQANPGKVFYLTLSNSSGKILRHKQTGQRLVHVCSDQSGRPVDFSCPISSCRFVATRIYKARIHLENEHANVLSIIAHPQSGTDLYFRVFPDGVRRQLDYEKRRFWMVDGEEKQYRIESESEEKEPLIWDGWGSRILADKGTVGGVRRLKRQRQSTASSNSSMQPSLSPQRHTPAPPDQRTVADLEALSRTVARLRKEEEELFLKAFPYQVKLLEIQIAEQKEIQQQLLKKLYPKKDEEDRQWREALKQLRARRSNNAPAEN